MVTRSDFIREDVELDGDWQVKRRENGATRGRSGKDLSGLFIEFVLWAFRLVALAGIVLKAIGAFRPHGGFLDFLAWVIVGVYFIGRLRQEAQATGERWSRT
jgi:hypothetical protein